MKARRKNRRPSLLKRLLRPQYLVVALLLLVGVVYLVAPQRIHEIVSVDGLSRWAQGEAPPQYRIVWQKAEPVEIDTAGLAAGDSLIRPQYAENGTALYFTLRRADGHTDIYRCRLNEDHQWQDPEPVAVLNSEADDVGPVIRRDGKRLYLYSNRPGGYGGFDIYVCDRVEGAWGTPRNLGPSINTPANEYDPAVSADGCRLFFASNQSPAMQARTPQREQGDEWRTTARADTGLTTFDLYMARRNSPAEPWGPAVPLDEINDPNSDEASPYLSPSGAFLYFVSKRPVREEEAPNFDIYRARVIEDRVTNMENLGIGVNTPANEMEPALSREGYTLFFSRNRLPGEGEAAEGEQGEQYGLYSSRATEVFERVGWGQSKLAALLAFLLRNWWWIVAFLLTLAFLAALIWYLREVSLKRLPVPGFFLTALLIHILLGVSSFYMYFGEGIYRQIKKEFEIIVAGRMEDPDLHQSHEPGEEAYEKLADLKSIERQETEIARRVTEMPNVPVPTENPAPEIPTRFDRDLPEDRLVATPPEAELETEDPTLDRRRRELERMIEKVELEKTQAAQATETELARLDVDVRRQLNPAEMRQAPKTLRRTLDPEMQLQAEKVAAERAVEEPMETAVQEQPELERQRAEAEAATTPEVATEQLTAPETAPDGPRQPQAAEVAVGRQAAEPTEMAALPTLRRRSPIDPGAAITRDNVQVEQLAEQGPAGTSAAEAQPSTLERAAPASAEPAAAPRVATEQLAGPVSPNPGPGQPEAEEVAVGRQAAAPGAVGAPATLRRRSEIGSRLELARADIRVDQTAEAATGTPGTAAGEPSALERAAAAPGSATAADAASEVATEALGAPVAGPAGPEAPAGVEVGVARQVPGTQVAGTPGTLHRPGAIGTSAELAMEDVQAEEVGAGPVGAVGGAVQPATLERTTSRVGAGAAGNPEVQTEALGAPVAPSAGDGPPRGVSVAVSRQQTPSTGLAALPTLRRESAGGGGLQLAQADVDLAQAGVGEGMPQAAGSLEVGDPSSLERAVRGPASTPGAPTVATEQLAGPVGSPAGEAQVTGVSVGVARQQAAGQVGGAPTALRRRSKLGSGVQLARADIQVEQAVAGPVGTGGGAMAEGPAELERATRNVGGPGPAEAVDIEQLAGTPGGVPGGTGQAVTGEAVGVNRQAVGQVGGVPMTLRRRGLLAKGAGPAAGDVSVERTGEPAPGGLSVGPKAGTGGPLAKRGRAAASIVADSPAQIDTGELSTPGGSGTGTGMAPTGVGVEVGRQGSEAPKLAAGSLKVTGNGTQPGLPGAAEQPGELAMAAAGIPGPESPGVVAQLARTSRAGEGLAVAGPGKIATEQPVAGGGGGGGQGTAVAGIDVGVDRAEGHLANIDVETTGKIGGPHSPRVDKLVLGSLDREAVDAPMSFSPHATRLARLPARAPATMYAEDSVGLQAMFRMRQEDSKVELVEKFGLSEESLAAVGRGLAWLAKHQNADGHWSLQEFYNQVPGKNYPDRGQKRSDTAATGFALLPFLGDGQTHQKGQYQANVRKGIQWLVSHQKDDGDLNVNPDGNTFMYAHAIATIALCEAYGMSRDPALREPAQKAVDFICWAQDKKAGGWRYQPHDAPDTSVVGWQVMALKSAQMAGLAVPQETLDLVPRWLDKVAGKGNEFGQYRYQPGRGCSAAMTAEALLCLQYLGAAQGDRRVVSGVTFLLDKHLPQPGKDSSYYWYYATQVMYHIQGPYWPRWVEAMEQTLLETQHTEGHLSGTWDSEDSYDKTGGRIYATCLRLLMLEVPYRHLPLYQLVEPEK